MTVSFRPIKNEAEGVGGEMGREEGGGGGGLPLAAHLYTERQMIIPAYLPKPAPDNIAFLGLP